MGGIVLDDEVDVHRLRQRMIVAHDSLRVQLRHARRADHDGRRPGRLRRATVSNAGARPFRRRPCHDANSTVDVARNRLQDALPLTVIEPRDFTRDPEHRHPVDASTDEQINDAPKAVVVDVTGRRERCRENRIDTLELHAPRSGRRP